MNIIAVDDEQHALRTISRIIKSEIPDVEPALFKEAEDALEYAKKTQVDIAFLDIEMGSMNGLTLAKHLKDIYGKTNIVFVTGHSEYAVDAHNLYPAGYLMKPVTEKGFQSVMENLRYPVILSTDKRMRVQTFGNFEVFIDDKPLRFPRTKSKEIFAYLIHKNGATCTMGELAAMLDEETPDNVRKYVSEMIKTLKEKGLRDVVIKAHNSAAVDTSAFDCDFYRYLKKDAAAVNAYTGEYMAQYPWAEFMAGYLDGKRR